MVSREGKENMKHTGDWPYGGHGRHGLNFIDVDFVVPLPAGYCLGSCKSERPATALANMLELRVKKM